MFSNTSRYFEQTIVILLREKNVLFTLRTFDFSFSSRTTSRTLAWSLVLSELLRNSGYTKAKCFYSILNSFCNLMSRTIVVFVIFLIIFVLGVVVTNYIVVCKL